MVSYREPAGVSDRRRNAIDPILEPMGMSHLPGASEYVIACGMRSKIVYIRWYGRDVEEVRQSFRLWVAQTWQTLTTDFTGVGVPNGLDFRPNRIEWFNIAD